MSAAAAAAQWVVGDEHAAPDTEAVRTVDVTAEESAEVDVVVEEPAEVDVVVQEPAEIDVVVEEPAGVEALDVTVVEEPAKVADSEEVSAEATVAVLDRPEADPVDEPDADALAQTLLGEDATASPTESLDEEHSRVALRLRGVTKSFGQTLAVDAIDLEIPAGTFFGIVGPNGAGKTTTLSMIAGLLRPDLGSIEIDGIDLRKKPNAAKRAMGILPDRLRTFDRLTGRQLLYYYGVLRGLSPAVVERRTNDLARAFDLTESLGRTVSDYSAGMTKKIMLAGAMIHSPRLLVLDEPFEAVDPVSSAVILDILRAYVAHGGTVILSSHGMELVERVCSGVAVIVDGQVLADGTVDEVRGEGSLAERFAELVGGITDVEGLEWLHTFSD